MSSCCSYRGMVIWFLLGLSAFIGGCVRTSQKHGARASLGEAPLASVDGVQVYDRDLPNAAQGELQRLRQRGYEVRRRAVEGVIDRRLLQEEAERQHVSATHLIRQESDQSSLLARLRTQAKVSLLLRVPRVTLSLDEKRVRGEMDAPVTIVEFADFECPFCRQAESSLRDLLVRYHGQVKLAYRDFPVRELHAGAELAAEASRCAAEQHKFWDYHDLLFGTKMHIDRSALARYAGELKLRKRDFEECLNTGRYISQVEEDEQEGVRAGVTGTPTFFIDGIILRGAQPARAFEQIIDEELGNYTTESATR